MPDSIASESPSVLRARSPANRRFNAGNGARSRARKPGDSGSSITSTAAITKGSAPLPQNSQRQPSAGRIAAAARPPIMPPIETHTTPNVTARLRQRGVVNSAIIAAAVPGTPPSPTPAKVFSAASSHTLVANPVANVATPNTATPSSSAARRPSRSPICPASSVPAIIPTKPRAKIVPSVARARPHSRINAGAASPSIWLSSPSSTTVAATISTTARR